MQTILVTGGNTGIGFALCKQLVIERNCRIILGSRNADRGAQAVSTIMSMIPEDCTGSIDLLTLDVGSDTSVAAAVESLNEKLGGDQLYAIVNNAGSYIIRIKAIYKDAIIISIFIILLGVGPQTSPPDEILNVNLFGPKRVVDAFGRHLASNGRVVNVGSGAGPMYVKNLPPEAQRLLCREPESWEQIVSWSLKSSDGKTGVGSEADGMGGYGPSKALMHSFTMLLAKQNPSWTVSCCSPGFIETKLTAGWGATKTPDEGTLAIKHCLFDALDGNGWYFGSDGLRSPYHFMRNPGEPEYDGIPPC